ncbi:MAG: O-antigen/teichoic acid export membrane protein [Paraglaciecola sp.]|jgi:O-antigen/teichoic acid export membrane protein
MKKSSLLIKTALTAAIKAMAAFIAFFMTAAITRIMGAEEAGLFLLAISILAFSSIFFRLGLDNVLLRLIGADRGTPRSIEAVSTGIVWSVLASGVFTLLVISYPDFLAHYVFSKPEFSKVISIMIWALPFIVVFMLLSFGFQAFYRVIVATWFQNLGLSFIFLVMFLAAYFYDLEMSAASSSIYYLIAAIVVCIWALILWHKQINGQWSVKLRDAELWNSSSNLWVASSMSLIVQWSGVLMAGIFVSSSEIAFLSAAQRTAMLTSFVLIVVNMVVAPRYALLWKENKLNEIQRLAKWSTRGMVVLALPIITFMLVMPDFIMGLFGDEFVVAGNLLAIMAIGQFINVATGSVGFLLNMSGHERDFRRVTMFAGPLTIILSYFFIVQWGVLGAAIATAVGMSVQNIGALFMVRKHLGFWPIG